MRLLPVAFLLAACGSQAAAWAAFEEVGNPFDRTIADKFRTLLLSTGNETDRAEAYRAFRGRDPDVTALLKRRGFPTN